MMYCPSCGYHIVPPSGVCTGCGKIVNDINPYGSPQTTGLDLVDSLKAEETYIGYVRREDD